MMTTLGFLGGVGLSEMLVLLAIVVLLFGATRIPEIARSLGKSVKEFKKAGKEVEDEIKSVVEGDDGPKKDGGAGNTSDMLN